MKITILGPGHMGIALATVWSKKGHDITFSHSKNEEKIKQILQLIDGSKFLHLPDAINNAEVIIITSAYEGLNEIFKYQKELENKTVISCTSNLNPDFSGNTIGLKTDRTISVAEEIQEKLPKTLVAEAFNTAFAVNIGNPNRLSLKDIASIFFCTDHDVIKTIIKRLIIDLQYEPVDAGKLKSARTLETLATVWVQMTVVANKYPGFGMKIVPQ